MNNSIELCAMILAAGFGTRLKPWTDKHPKALALVNGKSLLQRNIEYLQQFGIMNVIVNVHHFPEQIIDAVKKRDGWGSNVTISEEEDILETGGGLKKASWYFEEQEIFVLMNVDVLTDLNLNEMLQFHLEQEPLATLATTKRETSRYLLFDEYNNLCGWKNVKTGEVRPHPPPLSKGEEGVIPNQQTSTKREGEITPRAFSGIHIINTNVFSIIPAEQKFSIIDLYLDLVKNYSIKSFDHSHTKFIDVGKPESIARAEEIFE